MAIDKELIDKLLVDYKGPEDLLGEQGLLKQFTKALLERAMQAELTHFSDIRSMIRRAATAETRAMAQAQKPSQAILAKPRSRCHATAMAASSRRSFPGTSGASPASTTRFCRCMHGG